MKFEFLLNNQKLQKQQGEGLDAHFVLEDGSLKLLELSPNFEVVAFFDFRRQGLKLI